MAIAALTTYAADTTSTSTSSTYSLDADDFMTLLLTQLENQDPTDPLDMDTFTSQLCSLNQLQQSVTTNEYLEEIVSDLSSSTGSEAVGYIGKSVTYEGTSVSVSEGNACDLTFDLEEDASDVSITVYDSEGNEVRSLALTDLSSGSNSIEWDGTDNDGDAIEDGTYYYAISAYDSDGVLVDATRYSNVIVTGVVYEDGTPYLIAGGEEVSLDDITGVYQS